MNATRSGSRGPVHRILLPLNDATDVSLAGRKAATLAELRGRGFPVPNGWVVPPDCAGLLASGRVDASIGSVLDGLPNCPLAVRSSAIAEDTDHSSFAGQYESLLNVQGREALEDAIGYVWRSSQSERVRRYRASHGLADDEDVTRVAVLIQPMLAADSAGVAFSANPVTGNREEVVINAVHGLGDRLMAGEVDGATWLVDERGVRHAGDGDPAINAAQAAAIAELARRIERHFGTPQDIEWAWESGTLWLLQARPITVLPVEPEFPPLPPGSWSKEVDHFSGLMSVMQASLYIPGFADASRNMFVEMGGLLDRLQLMYRSGELYIQAVPLGERHGAPPPGWMLGLLARIIPELRKRVRQCRRMFAEGELELLLNEWDSTERPRLESDARRLLTVDLVKLDDHALADHASMARAHLFSGIRTHFRFVPATTYFAYQLVTSARAIFGWTEQEALMLTAATAGASSAPVRALEELADVVRNRPDLRMLIDEEDISVERISSADPAFGQLLRRYLDSFGHRVIDNEISKPTLFEREDLLLDLLRERINGGAANDQAAHLQRDQRDIAELLLRDLPARERTAFRTTLAYAERMNALREDKILYTMYLPFSVIRYAMLETGTRLATSGVLDRSQDVFTCTYDEVLAALCGTGASDLRTLVRQRHAEQAWVAAHPGPMVLGEPVQAPDPSWLPEPVRTMTVAVLWHLDRTRPVVASESSAIVTGIGVSPGRYTGPVRVIHDQTDFRRVKPGDVLICPVTTSAWGILFGTAGALVTDHGGMLSHPAIAAREHGFPAVVGTLQATTRFVDGQLVTVDGAVGTVELTDQYGERGIRDGMGSC